MYLNIRIKKKLKNLLIKYKILNKIKQSYKKKNYKKKDKYKIKKKFLKFYTPLHYFYKIKNNRKNFNNNLKKHSKKKLKFIRQFRILYCFSRYSKFKTFILKNRKQNPYKTWRFSKRLFFFSLIERRLDVLLFRAGFVSSLFEANQMIKHRFIFVNNYFNQTPSFILKKGDIVSLKPKFLIRKKKNEFYNFNKIGMKTPKLFPLTYSHFESNIKIYKIVLLQNLLSYKQLPLLFKRNFDFSLFNLK